MAINAENFILYGIINKQAPHSVKHQVEFYSVVGGYLSVWNFPSSMGRHLKKQNACKMILF